MQSSLLVLVLVGAVLGQDTYHCPDGWELEEDRSGCRCFYFSGAESVTKDDADVLCEFHEAWVAELDHPGTLTCMTTRETNLLTRYQLLAQGKVAVHD